MEKIKPKITNWIVSEVGKDVLTVLIVILVGLGSFGLGRLSKTPQNEGLRIEYEGKYLDAEAMSSNTLASTSKTVFDTKSATSGFFASRKGSKYYPVGCTAGKNIKQENRIYFENRDKAEASGYELSGSCR